MSTFGVWPNQLELEEKSCDFTSCFVKVVRGYTTKNYQFYALLTPYVVGVLTLQLFNLHNSALPQTPPK